MFAFNKWYIIFTLIFLFSICTICIHVLMFSCVFSLVWHTALALCDTVVIRQLAFAPGLQRRRLQIAYRKKTVLKAWCLTAWSLHSHTTCTVPLIAYSELSTTALTCSPLHSNWTTVSSKKMKNAPKKRKVRSQSFARCSRKLFVDVVLFPVFFAVLHNNESSLH